MLIYQRLTHCKDGQPNTRLRPNRTFPGAILPLDQHGISANPMLITTFPAFRCRSFFIGPFFCEVDVILPLLPAQNANHYGPLNPLVHRIYAASAKFGNNARISNIASRRVADIVKNYAENRHSGNLAHSRCEFDLALPHKIKCFQHSIASAPRLAAEPAATGGRFLAYS